MPASVSEFASSIRWRIFWSSTPTFSWSVLDVRPVAARRVSWNEAEVVLEPGELLVAVEGLERPRVLPVPVVGDPLQEEQREDVRLVVGRVDRPAKAVAGGQQPLLELLLT